MAQSALSQDQYSWIPVLKFKKTILTHREVLPPQFAAPLSTIASKQSVQVPVRPKRSLGAPCQLLGVPEKGLTLSWLPPYHLQQRKWRLEISVKRQMLPMPLSQLSLQVMSPQQQLQPVEELLPCRRRRRHWKQVLRVLVPWLRIMRTPMLKPPLVPIPLEPVPVPR